MLDGPVPDGARSVSWPWYHHVITNELTTDARTLFEQYAKIPPEDVENHIYRIVRLKGSRPSISGLLTTTYREIKPGEFFPGHALGSFGFSASAWLNTHSTIILFSRD